MPAGPDTDGATAGASRNRLGLLRSLLLILAGLVTTASIAVIVDGAFELLPWLALPVAACLVVAFAHLRHRMLALCVATAPLPGLLAVAAATIYYDLSQIARAPLIASWIMGAAAAQLLAGSIVLHVLDGRRAADAVGLAMRASAPAIAAAMISGFAALISDWVFGGTALFSIAAAMGAGTSTLLLIALSVPGLRFDEEFVTRANRLRERRERLLDPLLAVARPRWGFSLSGVALVFAVLGAFGLRAAPLPDIPVALLGTAGVAAIAACIAILRNWRAALSATLATAVVGVVGLWVAARLGIVDRASLVLALSAGFMAVLVMAAHGARLLAEGDDAIIASARVLAREASVTIAAMLVACASAMAFSLFAGKPEFGLAAVFAISAAAAVLFQPALLIASETIAPRRATIEARYRVR